MAESDKPNHHLRKLRGDSAQEYQDWKKEAEGYMLGLPDNVQKKAHGSRLYNLVEKPSEPYRAKDPHHDGGEQQFWDGRDEAFPEKEEMDKTEEALRGFFDLRMEKEDTTEEEVEERRRLRHPVSGPPRAREDHIPRPRVVQRLH